MLELLLFYDTRADNPNKDFRVLSCVIYTIIINYVCIYYQAFEYNKKIKLPVDKGGVFKQGNKSYYKILGIGIPGLLMNLMSCHGF